MGGGRKGGSHGDNDLGMNGSVLIVGCDAASWAAVVGDVKSAKERNK